VPQARKLAALYKRPLAVFFLSEPPVEAALPPDYRRGAGGDAGALSPAVRWRVRHLRDLRQAALDLAESDPDAFPPFPVHATLADDPSALAERLRQLLGVSVEELLGWRSTDKAWSHWRMAVEARSCLVFVLDRMPSTELDGFSLAFDRPVMLSELHQPRPARLPDDELARGPRSSLCSLNRAKVEASASRSCRLC
jgi:hypothetical protein